MLNIEIAEKVASAFPGDFIQCIPFVNRRDKTNLREKPTALTNTPF